jgi:putative ABC transport system permease protein
VIYLFKLILKNTLRHKLRTGLTILGIIVAIMAFGLLRTVVDAWYAGANATSSTRLVTRNAISLVFPLPVAYKEKIRQIPGVTRVAGANWFAGIYITEKNFFPQFAVDAPDFLALYPEYRLGDAEKKDFFLDLTGCVVGRKIAQQFGWKVGDVISLRGTIFPGTWKFVIRGLYRGVDKTADETQLFFHWKYLSETLRKIRPNYQETVGFYVVGLSDASKAAEVSLAVDAAFKNSLAETLTETEKAFQLSFVSMTEAILIAIQVVSVLVILIIMAVMANTMAMTARERNGEYATLKALGFSPGFITRLIFGESLVIALAGAIFGIMLTFPVANAFAEQVGALFPIFFISEETIMLQIGCAVLVGVIAALLPSWRAARVPIIEGLRSIG